MRQYRIDKTSKLLLAAETNNTVNFFLKKDARRKKATAETAFQKQITEQMAVAALNAKMTSSRG